MKTRAKQLILGKFKFCSLPVCVMLTNYVKA